MPARRSLPLDGWSAWLSVAVALGVAAPAPAQECDHFEATRRPFFGDVHIHSSYSFDAYAFEVRNTPRDAYRFARGEVIDLPPLDADGLPTRSAQLRVPLDFAAVTDHSEMLGETRLCTEFGVPGPACDAIRDGSFGAASVWFGSQFSDEDPMRRAFCDTDGSLCLQVASSVWSDVQAAAAEFDDPTSDCSFTTFVGYEWTAAPGGNNLHRNVLFRNASVPGLPLSYVEVQTPEALWDGLNAQCDTVGGDCRALTIPHNSNMSAGQSFLVTNSDGTPLDATTAARRRDMEPLVELIQHKGNSECRVGLGSSDEECRFEEVPPGPVAEDAPLSYVRNVLRAGLALDAQLGVNPFTLGLVGSTDTHNGTPGATREDDYPGHVGASDGTPAGRLSSGSVRFNPGGLMVLWAEENTRDSLYDAMLRREAYATSGTRPELRVFAGVGPAPDLCAAADFATAGYAAGVPMGGQLEATPASDTAWVAVRVSQDPGAPGVPGTPISEIQLVKGWLDAEGVTHERVVSVDGGPPGPDAVDPQTCETDGSGAAIRCVVWSDDDFDPSERAFYYARALESPTCRWSAQLCRDQGYDCSVAPPTEFAACCDGSVPDTIQERATSSPIWLPEPTGATGMVAGGVLLGALARRSRRSHAIPHV